MDKKESYKQIIKTTSLFGGVEIIRIIVNVVQTKVVAILLGPSGVGIINILNTALNMFISGFGFGLNTSAVKEVAQAKATDDEETIGKTIISLRRIIMFTAFIGAVCMMCFSKVMSKVTFGNDDYTFAYILLSLPLVFSILSNGQIALIKGMRFLKYLAKASLLGSFFSLIISVPLYYVFENDGIVYVIILSALSLLFSSWFYSRKIKIKKISIAYKESIIIGRDMLKMGFFLMLSTFLAHLTSLVVNSFITNTGAIDDVGYYRAGFLITSHYVGLIFTAMSADFLPRLSSVNKSIGSMSVIVHQQTELAILIILPLITLLFPLSKLFIDILYSSEFYCIEGYICWASLGLIPRACLWTLSYILLARGESKLFFFSELFYNATYCILCIVGYKFWSISGLGIAFCVHNHLCLIVNYLIVKGFCKFRYKKKMYLYIIISLLLASILFYIHVSFDNYIGLSITLMFTVITFAFSLYILKINAGLDLGKIVSKFKNKI